MLCNYWSLFTSYVVQILLPAVFHDYFTLNGSSLSMNMPLVQKMTFILNL